MTVSNKEVTLVEEQVGKCLTETKGIVISNQEEYDRAVLVGKKVNALLKMIDTKEKAITKPINDSLKQIRDIFRPYKAQVEASKEDITQKMMAYIRAEDAKKRLAEERIAARVEKGTMKEETAIRKLADVEIAAPVTNGSTTSVLRVKVLDIKAIPAEYLIIDEAKVKAAYRAGVEVPGVECFYETIARL